MNGKEEGVECGDTNNSRSRPVIVTRRNNGGVCSVPKWHGQSHKHEDQSYTVR